MLDIITACCMFSADVVMQIQVIPATLTYASNYHQELPHLYELLLGEYLQYFKVNRLPLVLLGFDKRGGMF